MGIVGVEDKELVNIQMPAKMDESDFQNEVFSCCGLIAFTKWNVQHSRCYGNNVEERLIDASVQFCLQCGSPTKDVVGFIHHMEKHHNGTSCHVCALCQLPYVTKVALDCHIVHNHGSVHMARRDYERKYKLKSC